ncbi:gag-protease polyprotein [Cucumis melo var. makuwa]|uniref:Gag-protease polyprotein n=1 Tax=Cucumis melo var. makuwa TaxID=1194695 RepID=A0A5D3D0P0_CUCMM|nr:gag-protease polyprotein [Cucumis melo var. makuwa]TYK17811.1 gag-protease polyprotein [Cucumis melo var. makuwa]
MPPRRGGRKGRGARRTQLEEQPATQATNPTASTPSTPTQVLVEPQNASDQLSAEAKHLRDFKNYNPKTFDGSLKDPTKAQMWLASVETIFNLRYAKQQEFLNLEQGDMIVEQYDAEFDMLSRFASEVVTNKATRTDKYVSDLKLDLQVFVRAFRPTTMMHCVW